ncbi:hypothetical protein NQ318_009734 [Aromia moschata]|uniref:Cilia- and flagella-associated protein 52 n=1 Tax=Aromia moschata TaxID=1265417 RepID=A0AAV8Y323_9CUCU|nr:hypothetical protein NQ318_009734 [Aromia moschata]
MVIVWDFERRALLSQYEHHKVRVEAVAFRKTTSMSSRWAAATASRAGDGRPGDDEEGACFVTAGDSHLALWRINRDARNVKPVDVSMSKLRRVIMCLDINERDEASEAEHSQNLRIVWELSECRSNYDFFVSFAEYTQCLGPALDDRYHPFCYCGTSTGDVLKIRLNYHHDDGGVGSCQAAYSCRFYGALNEKKLPRGTVDLYEAARKLDGTSKRWAKSGIGSKPLKVCRWSVNGYFDNLFLNSDLSIRLGRYIVLFHRIRSIRLLFSGLLIIGGGDGTVELVEETAGRAPEIEHVKMPSIPALRVHKSTNVNTTVTSIQLMGEDIILVATISSEIYSIRMDNFVAELIVTCHTSTIYDIAFPHNFSAVFATASKNDVRVWSMDTMQELLRIRVENFSCSSLVFAHDGKSILTGWSDGIIRSFTPLTGRLIYAILNAHNKGVSVLTAASLGRNIVSGGCEGQVRLWEVSPYR